MTPEAQAFWAALDFRTPAFLQVIESLSAEQLLWQPPQEANRIAWQLWHIAEVEDNWVRELLYGQERRFPFGCSVRSAHLNQYPSKPELLAYFHEVRALSHASGRRGGGRLQSGGPGPALWPACRARCLGWSGDELRLACRASRAHGSAVGWKIRSRRGLTSACSWRALHI
jgi:hypothetical protein